MRACDGIVCHGEFNLSTTGEVFSRRPITSFKTSREWEATRRIPHSFFPRRFRLRGAAQGDEGGGPTAINSVLSGLEFEEILYYRRVIKPRTFMRVRFIFQGRRTRTGIRSENICIRFIEGLAE